MKQPTTTVLPDPGITRGEFHVNVRTDGVWIVRDPRKPLGQQTVAIAKTQEAATQRAEAFAAHETQESAA